MTPSYILERTQAYACQLCKHTARASQTSSRISHNTGLYRRQLLAHDVKSIRSSHSASDQGTSHQEHQPEASTSNTGPQSLAAAHILAQARIEEADFSPASSISSRVYENQRKDVPWMGEESIEDAVLRMLVDKYKPLRVPGHKRKIQEPTAQPIHFTSTNAGTTEQEDDPNRITDQSHPDYKWRPGDPPRYPWEHSFKGPSSTDGMPLIRTGVITRAPKIQSTKVSPGEVAARVFRARDASLDYQSGSPETAKAKIASGPKGGPAYRRQAAADGYKPMPTSIKAWNSVIEERIELARQQGIFRNLKGRGKPIERDPEESNPYVGRSEFLMNRIVKRQEAAPPFVELSREMRDDMNGFRARLREAWIRRATRMISLQPITPSIIRDAGEYRDPEWEARERAYHEKSVINLNSLIRKYNVVAPPSARSPVTSVESELAGCYRDCAPLIRQELERRAQAGYGAATYKVKQGSADGPTGKTAPEQSAVRETMLSAFRRLVREVIGKKEVKSI